MEELPCGIILTFTAKYEPSPQSTNLFIIVIAFLFIYLFLTY